MKGHHPESICPASTQSPHRHINLSSYLPASLGGPDENIIQFMENTKHILSLSAFQYFNASIGESDVCVCVCVCVCLRRSTQCTHIHAHSGEGTNIGHRKCVFARARVCVGLRTSTLRTHKHTHRGIAGNDTLYRMAWHWAWAWAL